MEKINVAVIGLGWVATNRHIPIIVKHPRLHLFGVVDKRPERLRMLEAKYPWVKTSLSNAGEMPWGDNVHAVLIATDPLAHYQLAKNILAAGKHVLMEKPLTMSPEEGKELVELSKKQHCVLSVVHNFQFARSTLQLKKLMQNGDLGEIRNIEAVQLSNPRRRLPPWYEQLPLGLFYDESPHMFYMLEALSGEPLTLLQSTIIQDKTKNTPVYVSAHLIANKVPIRLTMNFEASLSEWHILVQGTNKVGIIDVFRDILVTLPNDGTHRAREILMSSFSAVTSHSLGFVASGSLLLQGKLFYGADVVWKNFIAQIEDATQANEISGESGLRIVTMQHQIMKQSSIIELKR